MAISDVFLDAVAASVRPALSARADLETWLSTQLAAARATSPEVHLDDAVFAEFLGRKVPAAAPEVLDQLKVADLFLAAACVQRDRVALERVSALCAKVVAREAGKARAQELQDDVLSAVRQILFTREKGPPAIAQYSGKGELSAWLRVIAVRELLRAKKAAKGHESVEPEDDALEAAAAPVSSPELGLLRGHYHQAFRAAFREAVEALESKERLLLRQHFLDGLSLDALAKLHQVHRATIARWLAQAREAVAENTRSKLRAHLAKQPAGLDSVLEVVGSQLDVSLGALLRTLHS